jgi:hypothetical protein
MQNSDLFAAALRYRICYAKGFARALVDGVGLVRSEDSHRLKIVPKSVDELKSELARYIAPLSSSSPKSSEVTQSGYLDGLQIILDIFEMKDTELSYKWRERFRVAPILMLFCLRFFSDGEAEGLSFALEQCAAQIARIDDNIPKREKIIASQIKRGMPPNSTPRLYAEGFLNGLLAAKEILERLQRGEQLPTVVEE